MIDIVPAIEADALKGEGVAHAFFTRVGGVSTGVYASLNGGTGSRDDPQAVAANRARMAARLRVPATHLLVPYLYHSAVAATVSEPWPQGERPHADGIVTATRGLALGVTGADCGIILFSDVSAGVVGAAHAGWKGALSGVIEATVAAMERLGARRAAIAAVLGPTIAQASYEVGPEFLARFLADAPAHARFFKPSPNKGHALFDLPAFILLRLRDARLGVYHDLGLDTYADPQRFFSFRRATHRGEPDYGRLVAAIART